MMVDISERATAAVDVYDRKEARNSAAVLDYMEDYYGRLFSEKLASYEQHAKQGDTIDYIPVDLEDARKHYLLSYAVLDHIKVMMKYENKITMRGEPVEPQTSSKYYDMLNAAQIGEKKAGERLTWWILN
jgi:hypothetical protein